MGGGLMQLVAYGAQDIYLTGNPQITFFKVVYRRHTNFSMEAIEQTFNGSADFGKRVTCTVSRNGDLMHRVYLQVTIPKTKGTALSDTQGGRWLNHLGHVLIKYAEVEIGGQRIDKHYGDWMHIWNELSQEAGKKAGYANMIGNVPSLTSCSTTPGEDKTANKPEMDLYIPLEFWFCRNPGLALPLIALQYHEVKINLEFRSFSECSYNLVPAPLEAASLFVDYIYLDTDERRRFAQVSHEYLIEQVQFTGDESVSSVSNKIKLNFNHPCKELIWVVQKDSVLDASGGKQWFNYTDAVDTSYKTGTPSDPYGGGMTGGRYVVASAAAANDMSFPTSTGTDEDTYLSWTDKDSGFNPVFSAKLQLNGHDRFSERMGRYFNLVQPYQHHTNVPATGINVYSFGLKPEEHQPSGTCNMSRIDNATLQLTLTAATVESDDAKVRVYATNYNVLRIMSGMGGLAYSN
uniref:Major capsid protein N-terminal domain-containing protein n=1 Tax=viral metagenome TaxID=1070528 RepID=A0A6C0L2F1_9ZZZZ|tara:strand:+ start:389 stop:1774 length:1386 start_codon:yes stop_codon:yes gene_type:complete